MIKIDLASLDFLMFRNYNVFLIGLCFAFIFTGFYTMSQTQVTLGPLTF